MTSQPLVTVLMNCYNGEKYLREAIDSVLAQTYENWEIIFWDNQSTDRSAEIANSYDDPRLRYFYAPRHTMLYEARNYAIAESRGDVLAFLDVDDLWLPHKLTKQVPLFADPDVGLVCGDYWIDSERKNKKWKALAHPAPTGRVLERLLEHYFVGLPTLAVRRAALDGLDHPCDPRFHVMGDFDLVIRLAARWKLDCVQEPIAVYRLHDNNETSKHRRRQIDEMELWMSEISANETVSSSPGFPAMRAQQAYMKGMFEIFESNKRGAYASWLALPWNKAKLRLGVALLLPAAMAKRLKN